MLNSKRSVDYTSGFNETLISFQLIPFLRDRNPQVRQIALSNLLGQTPEGSPHRSIFFNDLGGSGLQKPKETDIIRDLKLLCRDQLVCLPFLNSIKR
jgi:hypothetical protein